MENNPLTKKEGLEEKIQQEEKENAADQLLLKKFETEMANLKEELAQLKSNDKPIEPVEPVEPVKPFEPIKKEVPISPEIKTTAAASATPKIEIISSYSKVKEGDKREGIPLYGDKPLGGDERGTSVAKRSIEEIRSEIAELEKTWKSTSYVGIKNAIEEEIAKKEKELRDTQTPPDKKLKTAAELAMDGKIAWEVGGEKDKEPAKTKTAEAGTPDQNKPGVENDPTSLNKVDTIKINVNPEKPAATSIPVSEKIETTKEKKELYSREGLLNAAEIFCKYNPAAYYNAKPEELAEVQERALLELKKEHSEREIAAAIQVADKRNEMSGLMDRIRQVKKEYKSAMDNPNANISISQKKYDQQIIDITKKIRLIGNDYNPLLRELKIANLDNQLKNLEKYRDHHDFKEKVQDAELSALSIIQTEMVRFQDARIGTNAVVNPKGWDHVKNFFRRDGGNKSPDGYKKRMGRFRSLGIKSAIIGASLAAGAGPLALVLGGVGGYLLTKKIILPLVRKAYQHDNAKTLKEQQAEVIGAEGVEKKVQWWKLGKGAEKKVVGAKDESAEMKQLEALARGETGAADREEILGRIADFNIALSETYSEKIRRNKKYYAINRGLGTIAGGLIAGYGARGLADLIMGPGMLGGPGTIDPGNGDGIDQNPDPGTGPYDKAEPASPPSNGGEGGAVATPDVPAGPDLELKFSPEQIEMATVGEGEGIQHVLRRQLEADPTKFGFTGDLNDSASIKEWSGRQADLISIDQEYKGGGTETWVKDMGIDGPKGNPAYILDVDSTGKPFITEHFEGKASGTGGFNSDYEYSHDSPRYTSALNNSPEYYGDSTDYSPDTSYDDSIVSEYKDTAIDNVYENNIGQLLPGKSNPFESLPLKGLAASEALDMNLSEVNDTYKPLFSYLHKLQNITDIQPLSGEDVGQYLKRSLQQVAELERLSEVKL